MCFRPENRIWRVAEKELKAFPMPCERSQALVGT
jgi:hypothetical protein